MLKGKMGLGIASVALVGAIAVGGTLAWFTSAAETTNVVTFGNVKIEAKAEMEKMEKIVPGATVKDVATIKNIGANDAYIRAKVVVEGLTDEKAAEVIAALAIQEKWVLKDDGYIYYTELVAADADPVAVFDEVKIPTSWTNDMADAKFDVKLQAEAVQADNFTLAMDTSAPWGEVVVENNTQDTPEAE